MQVVKPRTKVDKVEYSLDYQTRGAYPGTGFSFPCDVAGNVLLEQIAPEGLENLRKCQDGTHDVEFLGQHGHRWTYRDPAVGICDDCGREVELAGFTNTCECGADYNQGGQRLAPREQWGEETGETVSDILAVDYDGRGWD